MYIPHNKIDTFLTHQCFLSTIRLWNSLYGRTRCMLLRRLFLHHIHPPTRGEHNSWRGDDGAASTTIAETTMAVRRAQLLGRPHTHTLPSPNSLT